MYRPLLMVLAACAGDDAKTDTADTAVTPAPTYPATWVGVQDLFANHCNDCHPATNGIDLEPLIREDLESGYNGYVVPGSSADSFLWLLVSGEYILSMPPETDGGLLPAETVAAIRDWIDAGASLE